MTLGPSFQWAALALAVAPVATHADPKVPAARAAARAEAASAPVFQSAIDGYRRFADQPVQDWRESNDTALRIGGWKAYLQEAQADDPPPAQPTPSAKPSAATPDAAAAVSRPASEVPPPAIPPAARP